MNRYVYIYSCTYIKIGEYPSFEYQNVFRLREDFLDTRNQIPPDGHIYASKAKGQLETKTCLVSQLMLYSFLGKTCFWNMYFYTYVESECA